ncbi:MAG: peptidoglycan DD-metalloendopeptidase family protein [Acidobacteria bacterium]|nr:peptidoglycan DD-metalloendopeptidase family protein [Acidobacteriota bacterium]
MKRPLLLLTLVLVSLAILWLALSPQDEPPQPLLAIEAPRAYVDEDGRAGSDTDFISLSDVPFQFSIQPGESLGGVLADLGLDGREAHAITTALASYVDFRRIRPGDVYTAYLGQNGRTKAFELGVEDRGQIRVQETSPGQWVPEWREYEREIEVRRIEGSLESTLDGAIREAGASPTLAYAMADALQWDLDFTRDLRLGDHFQVIFEQLFVDGRDRGPHRILALHYSNRGQAYEAFRYGDDGGFYDAEGRPLKKMFLRSPLKFSRVTSRFSNRRFHPVLKVYRPHYGVDYGAPTGTPVRATASGTVVSASWKGGGGRTVTLRHPNDYQTSYLHLSKFAKGMRAGRRVQQGEVIGYVGATGLATAPHLDYRVKHRGRWIDPLSIKSVPARPIPQTDLPEFIAWRDSLRRSLDTGSPLSEPQIARAVPIEAAPGATEPTADVLAR